MVLNSSPSKRPCIFFFRHHSVWREFSSIWCCRGWYLIKYNIQFALLKQRQLEEYKFSNSADHWKSRKRAWEPPEETTNQHFDSALKFTNITRALKTTSNPELFNLAGVETSFKNEGDFPGGPVVKILPSNAGGAGTIPG